MQQNGNSRRGRCAPVMASCVWLVFGYCSQAASAQVQDAFSLKARVVAANGIAQSLQDLDAHLAPVSVPLVSGDGRIHRIARIEDLPWAESVVAPGDPADPLPPLISLADVKHLQYVPPNAVLISAPASFDAEFWGPLYRLEGKLSADLAADATHFLVAFHSDIDLNLARLLVLQCGGMVAERPDLRSNELLVDGTHAVAEALAALDETSWIWPASDALVQSAPVAGCVGAVTVAGLVGEYVARIGEGWDGPGLGSAALTYTIQNLTAKLPSDSARGELQRALAEWSSRVRVDFQTGSSTTAKRNLNVQFATGSHGDGYSFDGRGRVLAHTFYPSAPNPEPIAGDVHFDDAENWQIGADVDLYSVALHELGHALGLGHSDKPGAVMYAYYRRATSLTEEDITAIQSLYAARTATSPTTPNNPSTPTAPTPPNTPAPTPPVAPSKDSAPPALVLVTPAASVITTLTALTVSGTAADNTSIARVTWQLRGGIENSAEGTDRWTARNIPLIRGTNYITIRAYDPTGNSSWRSLSVTRR